MSEEKNASLEVSEGKERELTEQEKKKLEKEKKKQERYWKSMITREEALSLATAVAREEVQRLVSIIREPIRADLVQSLAVVEVLKAKGLVKDDEEFEDYLDIIVKRLEEEQPEGEGDKGEPKEKEEGKR